MGQSKDKNVDTLILQIYFFNSKFTFLTKNIKISYKQSIVNKGNTTGQFYATTNHPSTF